MSNLVCSKCGSTRIMTERNPNGFHYCIFCDHRWKIGEKPTLFDRITTSPEVLAEKFVYKISIHYYCTPNYDYRWCSTLTDWEYITKEEAIAATVAKLKELSK